MTLRQPLDEFVEACARAAYALGDHLHPWDEASESLRADYRASLGSLLAAQIAMDDSSREQTQ